jgi:hypothetical protein
LAAVRTPGFSEVKRIIALDFSEVKRTIHLFLYDDFVLLYDDFDCNIRFGPVIFGKHRQWTYVARKTTEKTTLNGLQHGIYRIWSPWQPKWMTVCLSWAF